MGFNGSWLYVRADHEIAARVPTAIAQFFLAAGATVMHDGLLGLDEWRADPRRFGIAIAPPNAGWIQIVDSENQPDFDLAHALSTNLATPVVIGAIVENLDPIDPGRNHVFGASDAEEFRNLWESMGALRYAYFTNGSERRSLACLTFRGEQLRSHCDHNEYASADEDGEPPF